MFDGIVGQERATSLFAKLCEEQSFGHAYLLLGPEQVGKTTIAHRFAAAVLSHKGALTAHPDYYEIGAEDGGGISIESVRALCAFLFEKPFVARRKVAYVKHAEGLQPLAADALLKTLEEPAGECVIILTATHQEQLPATVRSRCQVITCGLVPDDVMIAWLKETHPTVDDETRDAVVRGAAGRPGTAVRFLDNHEAWAEREVLFSDIVAVMREDWGARMRWLQKKFAPFRDTDAKRKEAEAIVGVLEHVLHSFCRAGAWQRIEADALKWFADARHALQHHVSPQLVIENLFIHIYI